MREAIEAAGARLLYLPRYSPDLDPIEQLFAKLKAVLRRLAARTVDSLWTAVGQILRNLLPDECRASGSPLNKGFADAASPSRCCHLTAAG